MVAKKLIRRKRMAWKHAAIAILGVAALFFLLDLIFPANANIEYSPVVEARDGAILYSFLTKDGQWRMKARLDELTPELKKAIIYKEDKYFYSHPGVNLIAVGRAAFNNIFSLRRTSGASTITMQVARMLQPKPRTYLNKLAEMFRALQLELHYSKDEILQLYLNLVPYGSNIQGVKAASVLYFNKSPDQLSLAEITALSIIPNRPNSLTIGKDNVLITTQRNKWLKRFKQSKLFSNAIINDALDEPLIAYRHEAPRRSPQLAYRIKNAHPSLPEIRTTIDAKKQAIAEDIAQMYMNGLKLNGIFNASILVVDNVRHEVVVYIGSADHDDKRHNGEVDGIVALRSPGSTLKPLLYALCMDRGLITPKTIIADVPINIKGYSPENYDLSFHGNLTAEEALQHSLNIPAVKLLDALSIKTFTTSLTECGFNSIWQSKKKLGLSMILGGCGIRLEELTGLYSMLANNGNFTPLQYLLPDSLWQQNKKLRSAKSTKIISAEAGYMVSKILMQLHRPDLPNLFDQAANLPKIAWKTGTSYGRKDAWSVGYNSRYTIGVWVGNFNGIGIAGLNGAGIATPLLFRLFRELDTKVNEEWLKQPAGVGFRLVCKETGNIPNDYCTSQLMDDYIPGVSSNQVCSHLRQVNVSADERMSYCTSCLPSSGYKTKTYPNISAELTDYYETMHIPCQKIPPHNPFCNRSFDGSKPVINSLTDGMAYLIADRGKQQLQLSCTAANDVAQVYWYINNRFYKAAKVGEKLFFTPSATEIKISCTDDKGRNTDINVKVKFM